MYIPINNFKKKISESQPLLFWHAKYLQKLLKKYCYAITISNYEIEIFVKKSSVDFLKVLNILKSHSLYRFNSLTDLTAVDYPSKQKRFHIVYQLRSLTHNANIRVIYLSEEHEVIPSVTSLFSGANWMEREVWDLFGIFFQNHPDLRRLLTDYGFEAHPLRKDFPLTGFLEIYYDESKKRIVYDRVSLAQEYRYFEFFNSWKV